jgi:predicted phosphohydrolase
MSIFAISDIHLSLGEEKPMDVFEGWADYTERLKTNWRKLVKDEDTVVIAGDISWAMKLEETLTDFRYLHELPGKKLLLKGNHDYWWTTKTKIDNYLLLNGLNDISIIFNSAIKVDQYGICGTRGWMINSRSDEDLKIINRESGRLERSISEAEEMGVEPLVFMHYPPVYQNNAVDQFISILTAHNIKDCYYGHIHGYENQKNCFTGRYQGINMHIISCDSLHFCPLKIG